MGKYIGLDLGTTSISGLILDTESKAILLHRNISNNSEITTPENKTKGYSEWDIEQMIKLAYNVLSDLADESVRMDISAIGVTGQMHGMVLLGQDNRFCSPLIGWQDQRCNQPFYGEVTYLEAIQETSQYYLEKTGCQLSTGYMASTLFWLHQNAPESLTNRTACFAPDYLIGQLCGITPVTDPTIAASAGVFNLQTGTWDADFIHNLGLLVTQFPRIQPSCTIIGRISKATSNITGIPSGIPVSVACGDNQASFAGSVSDYHNSLLINIGTGGQISVFLDKHLSTHGFDVRPFLQDGFLLVGAGLCGGKSYRVLRDFVQHIGMSVFGIDDTPNLYSNLNRLASEVAAGSDGLRCEPIFSGSRREPDRRGIWEGMSTTNFTIGHMARSLIEGIAEQFVVFYEEMKEISGIQPPQSLIGSGNGIRENQLLRRIVSDFFSAPLKTPLYTEETAVGAALSSAVAIGEFSNIEDASRNFIQYNPN